MKSFLPAVLPLLFCLPLHAQLPAVPPPTTLSETSHSGLMALRTQPPRRATVVKKTVSDNSFTLTLQFADGKSTYTAVNPGTEVMKVVHHLVEGQEYAFPAVFDEVLGPPVAQPPVMFEGSKKRGPGVLDLATNEPFRARVRSKQVTKERVVLDFQCTDGVLVSMTQSGNSGMEEAQRIASLLQEGETYEFPDAVLLPGHGKAMIVEPSAEMQALAGFIGEWEMPLKNDPGRKGIVRYLWRKDGRAMWREMWDEPEVPGKSLRSAWLIYYAAARKGYVEMATNPAAIPPAMEMNLETEPRALALRCTLDRPEPGTVCTGRRVLAGPDRIEWSFRFVSRDGRVLQETAGTYTRR